MASPFDGNPFNGFPGQFGDAPGGLGTRTRHPNSLAGPPSLHEFEPEPDAAAYAGARGGQRLRIPMTPPMGAGGGYNAAPAPQVGGGGGMASVVPFNGPPSRDAGGLTPEQRGNFYRSVAANNGAAGASADAYRNARAGGVDDHTARVQAANAAADARNDAMTPPWLLNTQLARSQDARANQQADDMSFEAAARAGVFNADARRTNTLTPRINEYMTTENQGARQGLQENAQKFPLTLEGFKAETAAKKAAADAAAAQAAQAPAMAAAQVQATQAGAGNMKAIQDELNRHRTENQQLRALLAKYQTAKQGGGKDDATNALIQAVTGGGAAQQQVQNLNAAPTPGPAAQTMPMTPSTAQGGQQVQQMGQQGGGQGGSGQYPPGYYKNPQTGQRGYWDGAKFSPVG